MRLKPQDILDIDARHRLTSVAHKCSPYFNERPDSEDISLLVIHCISLPRGVYAQPYIDQLFLGELDCSVHPEFSDLKGLKVSAHLFIDRRGDCTQFVPFEKRAWHAGISNFQGREGCNDFSIGIELEGVDDEPFTESQYLSLVNVTQALFQRYPKLNMNRIVGHSDIAPGRKSDPGTGFDWVRYKAALA